MHVDERCVGADANDAAPAHTQEDKAHVNQSLADPNSALRVLYGAANPPWDGPRVGVSRGATSLPTRDGR